MFRLLKREGASTYFLLRSFFDYLHNLVCNLCQALSLLYQIRITLPAIVGCFIFIYVMLYQ